MDQHIIKGIHFKHWGGASRLTQAEDVIKWGGLRVESCDHLGQSGTKLR